MKRKILLIDDSLTVQKVFSLTFDKQKFQLFFAKTKEEAAKIIREQQPEFILVAEQLKDLNSSSFPREVEVWLGRNARMPVVILISTQEISSMRNYAGVLKKPFTPQMLQGLVDSLMKNVDPEETREHTLTDDKLHQKFHSNFSDENKLVEETLSVTNKSENAFAPLAKDNEFGDWSSSGNSPAIKPDVSFPPPKAQVGAQAVSKDEENLWGSPGKAGGGKTNELMSHSDSFAYKAALENQVAENISGLDLNKVVEKALEKLLPPLVEKLVQERLDRLMKENENFLELNP